MSTIEIQFDKKIDNSRVIREVDLRCRTEYICITLLGAVFVFGTLFYAWQQFQWIQHGYEIQAAERRIDELAEVNRQLRIERANLASPQRIERIARQQLGLVSPVASQYVAIDNSPASDRLAALYSAQGSPAP